MMDNFHTFLAPAELAKENEVWLATFYPLSTHARTHAHTQKKHTHTPHTPHKLDPVDRNVFGSFKRFYSDTLANWMRNYSTTF